jgi:hypothetical protein
MNRSSRLVYFVIELARTLASNGYRACSRGLRMALIFVMLQPALALAAEPSAVAPPSPPPSVGPPAPRASLPAAPTSATSDQAVANGQGIAAPAKRAATPAGQWSYTSQYGWVFLPYADVYTAVPSSGYPSMYVYGPSFGWDWVAAPWVLGVGPMPYWGPLGPTRFGWYAHGGFAHRDFRAGDRARFGGSGHFEGHMGHGRR